MIEYDYSVREVVRNPEMLKKELLDLGDYGWEVVAILEKSLPGLTTAKTGWIIVSKKVVGEKD